jgi:hypothetical protein
VVAGAMMVALEALGVDLDKFLDRDALPKQAQKALAKGIPAALASVPWETMPEVRWKSASGGEGAVVPREVLQWFVAQALKLKSPEPQTLLQRYCAMFVPADRERFGKFVLEWWIAEDLKTIPREVAEAKARDRAGNYHRLSQANPAHWADSPMAGKSEQQIYEYLLPGAAARAGGLRHRGEGRARHRHGVLRPRCP